MPILKMKSRMKKREERHIRDMRKGLMANIVTASGKPKHFYFDNMNILSLADDKALG